MHAGAGRECVTGVEDDRLHRRMDPSVASCGRDQPDAPTLCAGGVDRLGQRGIDAADPNAIERQRLAPGDRAEDRELRGRIGAAQIGRRIALREPLALRVAPGGREGPALLETPADERRRAVQPAAQAVDLLARE
jgi:hypothetical protein